MDAKSIYKNAYKILNKTTPLKIDCGRLCGAACCEDGGKSDAGMFLYPFEEVMFKSKDSFKIKKSNFYYSKNKSANLLVCKASCNRRMRPLSCRIFPLLPYITKKGKLKVIVDPRAKAVCPLAKCFNIGELEPKFIQKIKLIFSLLIKEKRIYQFVYAQSEIIDDYNRILG